MSEPTSTDPITRDARRTTLIIAAIAAVMVALLITGIAVSMARDTTGEKAAPSSTPSSADGYSLVVGKTAAPTTITIYEDFNCPSCKQFGDLVGQHLLDAVEAGDVKIDYRFVAFLDAPENDDYSTRALNAAVAVSETADEYALSNFVSALYAHQPTEHGGLSDDKILDLAVEAGADASEVEPLMEDLTYQQWIVNATDQMSKDGVTGTPTVFVDGKQAEHPVYGVLDALGIEYQTDAAAS